MVQTSGALLLSILTTVVAAISGIDYAFIHLENLGLL